MYIIASRRGFAWLSSDALGVPAVTLLLCSHCGEDTLIFSILKLLSSSLNLTDEY